MRRCPGRSSQRRRTRVVFPIPASPATRTSGRCPCDRAIVRLEELRASTSSRSSRPSAPRGRGYRHLRMVAAAGRVDASPSRCRRGGYDRAERAKRRSVEMAIVEADPNLGAQIVADAKEYVLYSWSVQSRSTRSRSPGRRDVISGTTRGSATSTSPRSSSTSTSATSTRRSSRRSRTRPTSSARSARRWRTSRARRLGRMLAEVTPGRPVRLVLHERRRRGERERGQARAARHGPSQDHRALPLVPRCDERRRHAHRRPSSLGGRAGHAGRRADVRPVHVSLPGRPSRSVPGLHRRAAPRGDPRVRGRAHRRRGDPRDGDRDERRSSRRPTATSGRSARCATGTASC